MMPMLFDRLLVHQCTLIAGGEVIGRDPYGRDIIKEKRIENVPCKFDQARTVLSTDQYGADFITRNMVFFSADYEVNMNMEIVDVRDKEGHEILTGSFTINDILPVYKGSKLHHYEVEVQRK